MIFTKRTPQDILRSNKDGVLNFQNLYSVYLFNNEPAYKKAITSPGNFTVPDGKIVSIFLKTKQVRGPTFTKDFLENKIDKNKKHFFILPKIEDLGELIKKLPKLKNSQAYSPPFIKGKVVFPKEEIEKMSEELKKYKPDYVWVCIGNPKQEILANQLYKKSKAFYFNVGAATDFLLGKKKEAPTFWRSLGLEWFYRLTTDFKYSKTKVLRSLIGLKYLNRVSLD